MSTTSSGVSQVMQGIANVTRASRHAGGTRPILLRTADRDHAINTALAAGLTEGIDVHHFSVSERRMWDRDRKRWVGEGSGTLDPAQLLNQAAELKRGGMVILEDVLRFFNDDDGDLRARDQLRTMVTPHGRNGDEIGRVLVFVEPPRSEHWLPRTLADQFALYDVPYPRAEELARIAREEYAVAHSRAAVDQPVEQVLADASTCGPLLAGLTRSAARHAMRDALARDPSDGEAVRVLLKRRKETLMQELGLETLDTGAAEFPFGTDHLCHYVKVMESRMKICGPNRARGIILLGSPGTGKTMFGKAMGHLTGLPVVLFRIGALMNSLLGETEHRLAQALAAFQAMSPILVLIDEFEKMFAGGTERDGGTMMRCTGHFLTFLSECQDPVYFVATSNGIERLGDVGMTLIRRGRFDDAFFVDVPCEGARAQMLRHWLDGKIEQADRVSTELAKATEKFSGADLFAVVNQAQIHAEYLGCPLSLDLLRHEVEASRERAIALYDQFEGMRNWARRFCRAAGPSD